MRFSTGRSPNRRITVHFIGIEVDMGIDDRHEIVLVLILFLVLNPASREPHA